MTIALGAERKTIPEGLMKICVHIIMIAVHLCGGQRVIGKSRMRYIIVLVLVHVSTAVKL